MGIYVDYSKSVVPVPVAILKSADVVAVGRYLGWDGEPGYQNTHKNITKTEADALVAAGIAVWLVFEYAPAAAARGASQGAADGKLASLQLDGLAAPSGMGVYFSVDYDIPDYAPNLPNAPKNAMAKLGPVGEYFKAIHATHPRYEVNGYGGFWAVSRLLDAGLINRGWQTIAWSGDQWDPRAVLRQEPSLITVQGISADVDVRTNSASVRDFGQWPRPVTPPPPPPPHPTSGSQKGWKYCSRCRCLFWPGEEGFCAGGGFHEAEANSYTYTLQWSRP